MENEAQERDYCKTAAGLLFLQEAFHRCIMDCTRLQRACFQGGGGVGMVLLVRVLHSERQTHPLCVHRRRIRQIQWAGGKCVWLRMDAHSMHQYRIHLRTTCMQVPIPSSLVWSQCGVCASL